MYLCASQFYFENRKKTNATMAAFYRHLEISPRLWYDLLSCLFNVLLFGDAATNQWALGRPILSIILADVEALHNYKRDVLAAQPPELGNLHFFIAVIISSLTLLYLLRFSDRGRLLLLDGGHER